MYSKETAKQFKKQFYCPKIKSKKHMQSLIHLFGNLPIIIGSIWSCIQYTIFHPLLHQSSARRIFHQPS